NNFNRFIRFRFIDCLIKFIQSVCIQSVSRFRAIKCKIKDILVNIYFNIFILNSHILPPSYSHKIHYRIFYPNVQLSHILLTVDKDGIFLLMLHKDIPYFLIWNLVLASLLSLMAPLDDSSLVSRSEEHTSELQSRFDLVCRLLLEKKNIIINY